MFKPVRTILDEVLNELGLVQGFGVQTYAEDAIVTAIGDAFDIFTTQREWRHLQITTQHTLSGTDGVVTEPIPDVRDFGSVTHIAYAEVPLTPPRERITMYDASNQFPTARQDHSYAVYAVSYGSPYYETNRVFQTVNPDLEGTVWVTATRRPLVLTMDTIVPFDPLALRWYAAAHMLASDGLNPQMEDRLNKLASQRVVDLVANENSGVHYLNYARPTHDTFTVAPDEP